MKKFESIKGPVSQQLVQDFIDAGEDNPVSAFFAGGKFYFCKEGEEVTLIHYQDYQEESPVNQYENSLLYQNHNLY